MYFHPINPSDEYENGTDHIQNGCLPFCFSYAQLSHGFTWVLSLETLYDATWWRPVPAWFLMLNHDSWDLNLNLKTLNYSTTLWCDDVTTWCFSLILEVKPWLLVLNFESWLFESWALKLNDTMWHPSLILEVESWYLNLNFESWTLKLSMTWQRNNVKAWQITQWSWEVWSISQLSCEVCSYYYFF